MGIDLHSLRLLQYATIREPLGEVATLGRQCVHVGKKTQERFLKPAPAKPYGPYCEELLLDRFGATSVTSFDASDYEHATVVHDMNLPLKYHHKFDTVIDLGTLEHVFNLPVALSNVAALCKRSGRIIHSLPANNYNGHGFYQFSPELFFSLYSEKNGFGDTEVFIAEVNDEEHWWKSAAPSDGVRVEYTSGQRSYVLAISRKMNEDTGQSVQQSDYVVNWTEGGVKHLVRRPSIRAAIYSFVRGLPVLWRFADASAVNTHVNSHYHSLSHANPGYRRVKIVELLEGR